jgi:hypothetical protein
VLLATVADRIDVSYGIMWEGIRSALSDDFEPEIAHLHPQERARILRVARRRARRERRWRWEAGIGIVANSSPLLVLFKRNGSWPLLLLGVALAFISFNAFLWSRAMRRAVQAELIDRKIRPLHCLACGYDLRESTNRCPECGTPFTAEQPASDVLR